jgi:hypothetical protein
MHQPIPAGKVVNFRTEPYFDPETNKQYNGVFVDAYVSKGAPEVWEMVLDGTLTGFSIGGAVKESDSVFDPELKASVRVIKEYDLVELSLVDSPANQLANIFSIQKTDHGNFADGIFNKSHIENVFWCEDDKVAFTGDAESKDCAVCSKTLSSVGWIDTPDGDDVAKAISIALDKHFAKSSGVITNEETPNKYADQKKKFKSDLTKAYGVGDFVQWGSSGGTARGKITRVVTNGKINVPNSSVTVTGTKEDPAVVITVYRKEGNSWKPTETKVGHKMKTLRSWSTKVKKVFGIPTKVLLSEETVEKAIETETVKTVANQNNEGGVQVAENLENTNDVIETSEVEEVVEVDEVAEEAADTEAVTEEAVEETVEKSDVVETEEVTTEVAGDDAADASTENGEATDLAKALSEIKEFISETVNESTTKSADSVSAVATALADTTSAITGKYDEVTKTLAGIQETIDSLASRVESVESDTAVKKSGELENAPENNSTLRKSVWGGRFLGSAEYLS